MLLGNFQIISYNKEKKRMEKEFVPYKLALRMKELGFEERCFTRYYESGKLADSLSYLHHNYFGQVNAPTFQQAFRWFRKEHNLKFHIKEDVWNNWCSLKMIRHDDYISIGEYKTYEEAELACLEKLIEIVENIK
jgi:hypothetical protein